MNFAFSDNRLIESSGGARPKIWLGKLHNGNFIAVLEEVRGISGHGNSKEKAVTGLVQGLTRYITDASTFLEAESVEALGNERPVRGQ